MTTLVCCVCGEMVKEYLVMTRGLDPNFVICNQCLSHMDVAVSKPVKNNPDEVRFLGTRVQ